MCDYASFRPVKYIFDNEGHTHAVPVESPKSAEELYTEKMRIDALKGGD